jgi:hypothetical protein
MKAATIPTELFMQEDDVRPEFASAAVVCLPEAHERQGWEIESWARLASRSGGLGAAEDGQPDESLVEILYRVAANLVR